MGDFISNFLCDGDGTILFNGGGGGWCDGVDGFWMGIVGGEGHGDERGGGNIWKSFYTFINQEIKK